MGLHLVVAPTSASLADVLAGELARPPLDPFTSEVIAVPGDGVRTWLTARLSERLGATGLDQPASLDQPTGLDQPVSLDQPTTPDESEGIDRPAHTWRSPHPASVPDGIVANIEVIFPAALIERAIGRRRSPSPWDVGPLTWAIHEVVREPRHHIGIEADAVRCRAIADLFDRYSLHRSQMLRAWESGNDVDAAGARLPPHLVWQPRLWRGVCELLGHPSGPSRVAHEAADLRVGRITPLLPSRVFLFGLASLPPPHLNVLSALATQIDVHVFAPTWSAVVWERVQAAARNDTVAFPLERSTDPTADAVAHPLAVTWGRAPREAQLLLASLAAHAASVTNLAEHGAAEHHEPDPSDPEHTAPRTLLQRLQVDLRSDRPPPGATTGAPSGDQLDGRAVLSADDESVRWHRCHGLARQAEVVRDLVVALLEERLPDGTPRYEPRDIVLLCPDPSALAPLVAAAFVGDPDHGVPEIPLRIADRSLREDTPLLDAVAAVLHLLDGRFRASEVLALAALDPVRARFGFDTNGLGVLVEWVEHTNVRWGADPEQRTLFGLPASLRQHSWQSGIDQLAVGAVMADPGLAPDGFDVELGPGDTVPAEQVEGDLVELLGSLAELVHLLHDAVDRLARPSAVADWCDSLSRAVRSLCALDDVDAWQWRLFDRAVAEFAAEASIDDDPIRTEVEPDQLAALFAARLTGRPGRARFGTGAVTLSSLTAQRGVPHPVVCLVGLDGDLGASIARSDDLMALSPCVGDRDPRSELRAQLLDAVLSAGERLVLTTTGHDLRTNTPVPPSVPVAELADLIDATVRTADPQLAASEAIAVDHPRHAWSSRNFEPGALRAGRPWSFDRSALEAASTPALGAGSAVAPTGRFVTRPLPDEPVTDISLANVSDALVNPIRHLLWSRLGVAMPDRSEPRVDLIPIRVAGLDDYRLRRHLLDARLAAGHEWDDARRTAWAERQVLAGRIPPGDFGRIAIDAVEQVVDDLVGRFVEACGPAFDLAPTDVDVLVDLAPLGLGHRHLVGSVSHVRHDLLATVQVGRVHPAHVLVAWLRLVALACTHPDRAWRAAIVGLSPSKKAEITTLRVVDSAAAADGLAVAIDTYHRSRRTAIPAFPATTRAVHDGGLYAGADTWATYNGRGEGDDAWVRFALGQIDYTDLVAEPPLDDECGPGWSEAPGRLERWANRVWGAVERSAAMNEAEVSQ